MSAEEPCSAHFQFPYKRHSFLPDFSGRQAGALIARKGAVTTLPKGINLNQYKTQAKELLKQARAAQPEALDRLQQDHPGHNLLANLGSLRLADTQLVVARENEFPSWLQCKQYWPFRNAVQALDAGDIERLESLLDEHPWLVRYRCQKGEGYEEGYFAGATLLHHIAGNPSRCPIPRNNRPNRREAAISGNKEPSSHRESPHRFLILTCNIRQGQVSINSQTLFLRMPAEKLKFQADDSFPTGRRQRAQTGAVSHMTDNCDCGNG